MSVTEQFKSCIDEATSRLIARAAKSFALEIGDVLPRVEKVIGKYHADAKDQTEIRNAIDALYADDLCLILACEKSIDEAWNDLVRKYDATVKSAARKITSNNEDADDLAGSIWAELHGLRKDAAGNLRSKLSYYSGKGSLGGWLRAVTAQLAIDEHRKISRYVQIEEPREFENKASESEAEQRAPIPAHHENPEKMLDSKRSIADLQRSLVAAVSGLGDEDRLLMKLYYFDDMKLKDIGAMFGFHEATASRKLVRVQAEIRKSVENALQKEHGWTAAEVQKHLSETASAVGVNLERMFASLIILALVQVLFEHGVQ